MAPIDKPKQAAGARHDPLTQRLTFMLSRTVALMNGFGRPDSKQLGLNIPQARVLITLGQTGPLQVGPLAELVSLNFSTVSHLLRRLEADALIERYRDDTDARSIRVALTPAGARMSRRCRDASLRHEELLVAGLSDAQVRTLKRLLTIVANNAASQLAAAAVDGDGAEPDA